MLRDIRSPFLRPRLLGLNYTTAGNAVTVNAGVGVARITSAANVATLNFGCSFARRGVVVATGGNDALRSVVQGTGSAGTGVAYPNTLSHVLTKKSGAGATIVGTTHAMFLGFDSVETLRFKRTANVVRSDFARGVLHAFKYDSTTPSISIGGRHATITKTGTGDVTLTFKESAMSGATNCVVCAIPVSATGQCCTIVSSSGLSVRILSSTIAGAAVDAVVNVLVLLDKAGTAEKAIGGPLASTQRKPILFGYSVLYTAGAPVLESVLGAGDVTIANTGTGRVTFTFAQGFQRNPIMIATPIDTTFPRYCTIDNVSNSAFEVKVFSSSPGLVNPANGGGFQVIGIGFDDSTEY